MNKLKSILTIGAITFITLPLMAQQKRVSPHETVSAVIDGNRVTIVYGRPYTKDPRTGEMRKIWGGLVPYGKVWRTGADEATLLITQKPIMFGDTAVPAGAYTLFTLPQEDGTAKLIINKQIGQWGVGPGSYDEKQDLARIDLKKDVLDKPVDQFTIAVSKNPSGGGVLKMMWENTQYSGSRSPCRNKSQPGRIMNSKCSVSLPVGLRIDVCFENLPAQTPKVDFPAASPACTLKQRVGLTDIEIDYSRPGVKESHDFWRHRSLRPGLAHRRKRRHQDYFQHAGEVERHRHSRRHLCALHHPRRRRMDNHHQQRRRPNGELSNTTKRPMSRGSR